MEFLEWADGLAEGIETLGREVRECEAALVRPERGHAALRARIVDGAFIARRQRRIRHRAAFVTFVTAIAVVAGWFFLQRHRAPLELGVRDGRYAGQGRRVPVGDTDGAPRASLRRGNHGDALAEHEGSCRRRVQIRAELVIESSQAALAVVPREGNHWLLHTGPFLNWATGPASTFPGIGAKDSFVLDLLEGKVVLSGCVFGEGLSVTAGDHVEAACGRGEYRVSRSVQRNGRTEEESRVFSSTPSPPLPRTTPEAPPPAAAEPEWHALAKAGRFSEAHAAAVAEGSSSLCAEQREGLLLLGDAARLSGHDAAARTAYRATRERFPRSSAAVAAFYLGRMELDQGSDPSSAEKWLDAYLDERPEGPLAAAALGRLLEMSYAKKKNGSGVRALATEYLHRFPSGPHATTARRILASEGGSRGESMPAAPQSKGDGVESSHDGR